MSLKSYIVLILNFCGTILIGQHKPYINYTTHQGLPQIQVQFLHQDQKGYIWVGTKGGLAKFNGERFEKFLHNQYIYGIEESKEGTIYITTRKAVYQYHRGKMSVLHTNSTPTSLLAGNSSNWLFDTHSIHEIKGTDTIQSFSTEIYFSHFGYSNFFDQQKNIPFFNCRNDNKCIQYIENKKLKKIYFDNFSILRRFENGSVYVLTMDKNKAVAQDPLTRKIFFEFEYEKNEITRFTIHNVPVDKHLFYYGYLKYFILNHDRTYEKISFPFIKEIYSMVVDKDNNYWAATDNGLYQISNGELDVFPRDYINDFWTFIKGDDGYFYGGEYQKGLYKLNLKTKTQLPVFKNNGTPEEEFYYGASKDLSGNLYFPTQNGVYKYNYQNFKQLDNAICLITKYDSVSDRIIAGQENGLAFFDQNGHKTTYKDSTGVIIFSRPTDFLFKNNDEIWVGSWENLAVFNRRTHLFNDLDLYFDHLPPDGVIAMEKDYRGNIWLGGTDGLWFFNNQENKFIKIKPKVLTSYILAVKSIGSKYLIVGTSHELYIFDLQRFYFRNDIVYKMYNFRNGFISEEIAQNGFYMDGNKLYIPSTTSMSVLDVEKINFTPNFFNVWVTSVNGQALTQNEQNGTENVVLKNHPNKLDIVFETVGFGLPTSALFQYKLEGYDTNWSAWENIHQVNYSNLKSGLYTFKIRAVNGSQLGIPNLKENAITIKIDLPFYKEPYFYKLAFFALLLVILMATYFVYMWYKNRIKVADNERKLKLQEIATLQAQLNPHFIFNFLSSVQSIISQNKPEKANEYLVKFSRLMRNYMEASIKSTKIFSGFISGNEISIKDEIEMLKTYMDLEKMKYEQGKINYEITVEDDGMYNKTIPPLILQPFVENAIKHGILPDSKNHGLIKICFQMKEDVIWCSISDNGIGRIASIQKKEQSIPPTKSRGLELIKKRVEILNQLDYHITVDIIDPEEGGTLIQIKIQ